jgi:hypothetical protein
MLVTSAARIRAEDQVSALTEHLGGRGEQAEPVGQRGEGDGDGPERRSAQPAAATGCPGA